MKHPTTSTLSAFALLWGFGQPLMAATPTPPSPGLLAATILGDLSSYKAIAVDTLELINKGDITGAQKRGTDLETAWDKAEDRMKPSDPAKWRVIDKAIDRVLNALRAPQPQQATCASALNDLISAINKGGAA